MNYIWHTIEGEVVTVGLSEEALKEVVGIDFPKVGQKVKKEEIIANFESQKAVIDIPSPVSGTVIAINKKNFKQDKWLFKLKTD